MSEQLGEKTEQATPRKLEEALKKGQFPRSAEVQTVFVLAAALQIRKETYLRTAQGAALPASQFCEHRV